MTEYRDLDDQVISRRVTELICVVNCLIDSVLQTLVVLERELLPSRPDDHERRFEGALESLIHKIRDARPPGTALDVILAWTEDTQKLNEKAAA